jgi:predicted NAD-dependent protein-ADP-ribosyltransferase YbiA (DUF1768 family)
MKTKELKIVVTAGWDSLYGGIEGHLYFQMATAYFRGDNPFQYFSFEFDSETQEMVISVSGTNYKTNEHYVEIKEIARFNRIQFSDNVLHMSLSNKLVTRKTQKSIRFAMSQPTLRTSTSSDFW